jgi:hypothetical protein
MGDNRGGNGTTRWRCAACGEVIGVYERVWLEDPDGRLAATSLLNLGADVAPGAVRLLHSGCIRPAEPPA